MFYIITFILYTILLLGLILTLFRMYYKYKSLLSKYIDVKERLSSSNNMLLMIKYYLKQYRAGNNIFTIARCMEDVLHLKENKEKKTNE